MQGKPSKIGASPFRGVLASRDPLWHKSLQGLTPNPSDAFIKTEIIDELGINVTKASEVLGVRRATLSDLLNEKPTLSPEMPQRLGKAFNLNMEILLRMQAWHDASEMRNRPEKSKLYPMFPPRCRHRTVEIVFA